MTRDFVNPERPWPHLSDLAAVTAAAGFDLVPRLPVYPEYLPLLGGGGGRRAGFRGPENKEGEEEAASQQAARRPLSPPRQQEWIAEGGGQEGIRAAVLRHADSSGYVRGEQQTWIPRGWGAVLEMKNGSACGRQCMGSLVQTRLRPGIRAVWAV